MSRVRPGTTLATSGHVAYLCVLAQVFGSPRTRVSAPTCPAPQVTHRLTRPRAAPPPSLCSPLPLTVQAGAPTLLALPAPPPPPGWLEAAPAPLAHLAPMAPGVVPPVGAPAAGQQGTLAAAPTVPPAAALSAVGAGRRALQPMLMNTLRAQMEARFAKAKP